jgi:hypothetical protein
VLSESRHTCPVAYDEDLAHRIRALLRDDPGVSEQRMFGGLAFLVGGHLAAAASGQGGLLLRVDPARTPALARPPHAHRAVMRGRQLDGWLRVDPEGLQSDAELRRWVGFGVDYARSLPVQ